MQLSREPPMTVIDHSYQKSKTAVSIAPAAISNQTKHFLHTITPSGFQISPTTNSKAVKSQVSPTKPILPNSALRGTVASVSLLHWQRALRDYNSNCLVFTETVGHHLHLRQGSFWCFVWRKWLRRWIGLSDSLMLLWSSLHGFWCWQVPKPVLQNALPFLCNDCREIFRGPSQLQTHLYICPARIKKHQAPLKAGFWLTLSTLKSFSLFSFVVTCYFNLFYSSLFRTCFFLLQLFLITPR